MIFYIENKQKLQLFEKHAFFLRHPVHSHVPNNVFGALCGFFSVAHWWRAFRLCWSGILWMISRFIIIIINITTTYKNHLNKSIIIIIIIIRLIINICWFCWPCGLRLKSTATELLGSRVRILLKALMLVFFVFCCCCKIITHSGSSYLMCVSKCVWSRNLNNEMV